MGGEKTESATPMRRREARERGQVAKSVEVNTAFVLLACFWVLRSTGPRAAEAYFSMTEQLFSALSTTDFSMLTLRNGAYIVLYDVFWMIGPLILSALVSGVIANVLQVRLLFSAKAIKPEFNKINPINGFKRLFSLKGVVELMKSLIKMTIVGVVVYNVFIDNIDFVVSAASIPLSVSVARIADISLTAGIQVAVVMLFIGVIDYVYQRWEFERSLRMSKQEVKEEMKRLENPQLKARIRSRQRQMAMSRMMAAVPAADVVITNPTHLAIALHYKRGEMSAPMVVAKGERKVAERIKLVAAEHQVPTVENKPLARALFSNVEINFPIPDYLFQAVAEVLAFVYRIKSQRTKSRF